MIVNRFTVFRGKRVLLLQGPLGPFFRRLARDLAWVGAQVTKVNFNGGDWLFYPWGSINYRGRPEDWPAFFERLVIARDIEVVLLFGDCRPVHQSVHQIAHRLGIEVGVFEEGYIRPDYITFERFGVNAHSLIPRSPIYYLNAADLPASATLPVGNTFWFAVLWAILYYGASTVLWPWFRHYHHHRPLSPLEGLPWLRGVWRKLRYRILERGRLRTLSESLSKLYFLVPLQIHTDAQVQVHSNFNSVPRFIREVMHSFAHFAPRKTYLVIKHHPLDRGYHDYSALIKREARALGIEARVMYIHDQHLPTLLHHARGVVVINSTVGLSAIHHNAPTKACGAAIYDMAGLTFSGSLDSFWRESAQTRVDRNLYRRFRGYLVTHTQLNGNFYRRLDVPGSYAGLTWIAQSGGDAPSPGATRWMRAAAADAMGSAGHDHPAEVAVSGREMLGGASPSTEVARIAERGEALP